MTEKERRIQDFLMNWKYTLQRIERLNRNISEMSPSVTSKLDLVPSRAKGSTSNKVESFCIRKARKELERDALLGTIRMYERAIKKAKLTDRERGIIECLKEDVNISDFAKREGIYSSYAYKIKDGAISKIARFIKE